MSVAIRVVKGPICPKCGGAEVLLGGPVRPFKVHNHGRWWSNCTTCGIWFDENDNIEGESK
jgi:hypothetical protein